MHDADAIESLIARSGPVAANDSGYGGTMSPNTKSGLPLHKFHVVLADGSERDVTGEAANVVGGGALVITSASDEELVMYAAGAWTLCEQERKDDR